MNFILNKKFKKMIDTLNLKEKLLYEVNHSKPERLEMLYYFIQTLKKPFSNKKDSTQDLSKFAGIIDNKSANEMLNCINNEFSKIEGEW